MATLTNSHRSRSTRYLLRLLVLGCAVLAGASLTVPVASADPPVPDNATEAAQLVAQLGRDLEVLQEEQNEAQVALDQHIADAAASTVALGTVNARLVEIDGRLRGVARSAFAGNQMGSLSALLTAGSPQEVIDRINTLEFMSGQDGALLDEASRTHDEAEALSDAADTAVAASQGALADIAVRRADLETRIKTFQDLYNQLSADERRIISGDSGAGGGSQAPPGEILAPTEAARIAVETAYAQLGDTYVWGGDGPDEFDCSGLTMYSYAAAGVSLPHSSRSQSTMGIPVSRDELQPGDLVFYYSPVSHVAIYVGDGQIIHASTFGVPVSLDPVDPWGAYNSARRITG